MRLNYKYQPKTLVREQKQNGMGKLNMHLTTSPKNTKQLTELSWAVLIYYPHEIRSQKKTLFLNLHVICTTVLDCTYYMSFICKLRKNDVLPCNGGG